MRLSFLLATAILSAVFFYGAVIAIRSGIDIDTVSRP